jgi:hypothetical protein
MNTEYFNKGKERDHWQTILAGFLGSGVLSLGLLLFSDDTLAATRPWQLMPISFQSKLVANYEVDTQTIQMPAVRQFQDLTSPIT